MNALRRIRAIARKELKVLLRDRFYLFMAIVFPLVTMVTMGYGMTYDVKGLLLGVADLDHTPASHQLSDAFVTSGYFRLVTSGSRPDALDEALEAGRIRVAMVIPPGFGRRLHGGRSAEVQVLVDASLPTRADIARGYVEAIIARFNQERLQAMAERAPGAAGMAIPRLEVASRIWYNPTLESKNFLVPGLLVLSILFWAPILISLSVTREKETGAILNVQTVPLARWEYVIGKMLPYAGVSFLGYWLLLLASVALFRVPLKGSVALLTVGALVYVVSMIGVGLLVSMLVRTQVAALLVTGTLVMTLGLFYSGWLEPVGSLDETGRALSRLLPTADFVTMTRGVFLKGLGLGMYRGTLLRLALYAIGFIILPVLAFRVLPALVWVFLTCD